MIPDFKKILFLVHSLPPHEFTGTPIITFEYAKAFIQKGYKVGVVYPSFDDGEYLSFVKAEREEGFCVYEVPFTEEKWIGWSIFDSLHIENKREQKFNIILDILIDFNPDIIHVVDNVNLPTEWIDTIKSVGIPIVRQVWNLEDVCGRIEPFIQESLKLCPSPFAVEKCIDCCLRLYLSDSKSDVVKKKSSVEKALTLKRKNTLTNYSRVYDSVIFPSLSLKNFFLETIPVPTYKIKIVNNSLAPSIQKTNTRTETKIIKFIFLGNINLRKGISLVSDVFLSNELLGREDYELSIYGAGDLNLIKKLTETNARVKYLGTYSPINLPDILNDGDVGLSPSYFETLHRVTREYLTYGLPVIGSTTFGIPDVVKDGINGLIFQTGDAVDFKEKILQILDDKTLLDKFRANINVSEIKSFGSEVDEIIKIYESIWQEKSEPKLIFHKLQELVEGVREKKEKNQLLAKKIQLLESKLASVENNLTWRILNRYIFHYWDKWIIPFGSKRRAFLERFIYGKINNSPNQDKKPLTVKSRIIKKSKSGAEVNKIILYINSKGNYFFTEVRDLIAEGIRELGYNAEVKNEINWLCEEDAWHIVVAPHEFFYLGALANSETEELPENLILVNTEQPSTKWASLAENYFPAARYIWDINYDSAKKISKQCFKAEFLPLGFASGSYLFKEISQLPENYATCFLDKEIKNNSFLNQTFSKRPIDISFVGALTPRRDEFFAKTAEVTSKYKSYIHLSDGLTAPIVPGVTTHLNTDTVLGIMQRSKISLNIHHGGDNYFEWHRIVLLGIAQKTLVISEPSISSPIFEPGNHYVEAELKHIPEKIKYYLSTSSGIKEAEEIIERGYKKFTEDCKLNDSLRSLISELGIKI